jgi:DNA replication protein DnaC
MLQSLAITPGTGKTHLATGIAIRACQAGHRVAFATAAQWVARLAEAHHAGRLQDELTRLGRTPLLVIDLSGGLCHASVTSVSVA